MKRIVLLTALFLSNAVQAKSDPCVIPSRGFFRIHVGTAGLLSAFAHNHLIEASMAEGCAILDSREPAHSSIKLTFAAAKLHVMDPGESEKDRAAVQQNMETEVLQIAEFPRIVFESTFVEISSVPNQLRVHGNLTLLGKTQPVVIALTFMQLSDGTYQAVGKYNFKQSSFGIKPIQLAGGTIKVKDELQTEFEIYLK